MDDVHFNTSRLQPPRKPETVAPGLESKRNPLDHLAGLDRLVTPALDQSQQHNRIRPNTLRFSTWQFQDKAQEASYLHGPVEQPIEPLAAGILMPACPL